MKRVVATQIAKHVWPQLIAACLASGLPPTTFGRNQGLTQGQCQALRERITRHLADKAKAMPDPLCTSSESIMELQHGLRVQMLTTAERARTIMERFNVEYAPKADDKGVVTQPIPEKTDLSAWKWAWQVGRNVLAITAHTPTAIPGDPAPPVREVMDATPRGLIKRIAQEVDVEAKQISIEPESE